MWYGSIEKAKGALIALSIFQNRIHRKELVESFELDVDNCETYEDITKCFDEYFLDSFSPNM